MYNLHEPPNPPRVKRRPPYLMLAAVGGSAVIGAVLAWFFVIDREPGAGLRRVRNTLGMEFIEVPAGTFTMGSPPGEKHRDDDEQAHEVEITRPFFIGVHEVTQRQFEAVMGFNPSMFANLSESANHPVENVAFDEAREFCEKLSAQPGEQKAGRRYRLPTEAEWEYACRAGTNDQPYAFGRELPPDVANTRDHALAARRRTSEDNQSTTPVGAFRPNAWGIFDMHGNVREWCSDWYAPDYPPGRTKDPTGPPSGERRVVRGGSRADLSTQCRSANRVALPPAVRLGLGLRVVMEEPGNQ